MSVISFAALCVLLALGKYLRVKIKLLQKLYLPTSVIAGLAGLIIIQILQGPVQAEWVENWTVGWSKLPGFLINIVFAALFLGVAIPPLATIWKKSGPQLAYGQIVAWGQYVVGLGIVLVLLGPIFKLPDMFGVIVEIGFEGGHGTVGGLRETFKQFNWEEGTDYGLASATFGIMSAIIVGMILINWAARKGYTNKLKKMSELSEEEMAGIYRSDNRPVAGYLTVSPDSVDSMALHLALLGIAILIGYCFKQVLIGIETQVPVLYENKVFHGFPLFPLCMIGGLIVQSVITKFEKTSILNRELFIRWAGTALDFLVVAAISTIRLDIVAKNIVPFLIIIILGIAWNVFCVMFLAKRLLPNFWFERSIAEMGQSMGVTATGLLLLRCVDPNNETDAPSAFAYKQLLHEPFMGGGLWTSSAIPLIFLFKSGVPVFFISVGAIVVWFIVWAIAFRKLKE